MRIAFFSPFQLRLRRGIERYVAELAPALAQQGVWVDVLTWSGPESWDALACDGVRVLAAPRVRYYQHLAALPWHAGHMLRYRYDHAIVFFADYGEGLLMRAVAPLTSTPFSVVFHFPRTQVPHRYETMARWGLVSRAQHLIAVSQFVADQVEDWSGRSCMPIGHGVDADMFRPDPGARARVRSDLGISPDAPVIVTAAALEERKGVQWVLRALPLLHAQGLAAHYLILGDGPHRAELERLTASLGIASHVHFLGHVSHVPAYLAAADVGVLLSSGEASSLSLLEYLATGLPALVSYHPPFDELAGPGWALQVDEQDSGAVAEALARVLTPERCATMGRRARRYVLREHRWESVAERYLRLLSGTTSC